MTYGDRITYRGFVWFVEQGRVVVVTPGDALMATWQSSCSEEADTARAEGWIDGYLVAVGKGRKR